MPTLYEDRAPRERDRDVGLPLLKRSDLFAAWFSAQRECLMRRDPRGYGALCVA
jgi:hypothetical protein